MDETPTAEDMALSEPEGFSDGQAWAMVESSPDGMLLVDDHGRIIVANSQVEALFGLDRHRLVGRPVEDLLPERFRKVHSAHRIRYRAAPHSRAMGSDLDLWARRNDGSEFPVEVSLSPIPSIHGSRIVATVRDVTARHEAEAEAHAVLHTVDSARDGVFMFDPTTLLFTYVNRGAEHQLGYSVEELLTMTPIHIKPEFSEPQFRSMIEPLLVGDSESLTFCTIHRRKTGDDVPVEIVLEYPASGPSGRTRRMVAVVRDISERVETDRALTASEEAFRTAFDAAPVGMALADFDDPANRRITRANRALCRLLGYSESQLLGKSFVELTHHEDIDESAAAAGDVAAGQFSVEQRYHHADGSVVPVWVHSAVLNDGTNQPSRVLVHIVDLTEAKRAQADEARVRILQDRERLAEDLHDLIIQRLFATGMAVQSIQNHVAESMVHDRLSSIVDELDYAISDLRSAIFHLHSPLQVNIAHDLDAAIEAGARTLGFQPNLNIVGDLEDIPGFVAEQLLPVITEAISNVARHADGATSVDIDLTIGDTVALTITDNGPGLRHNEGSGGHGLRNLRTRAERVGGTSSIRNAACGGAVLSWTSDRVD